MQHRCCTWCGTVAGMPTGRLAGMLVQGAGILPRVAGEGDSAQSSASLFLAGEETLRRAVLPLFKTKRGETMRRVSVSPLSHF